MQVMENLLINILYLNKNMQNMRDSPTIIIIINRTPGTGSTNKYQTKTKQCD